MRPVIMWFRRDLRLDDHEALVAAASAGPVVPLFVVDPVLMASSGAPRRAALAEALASLDDQIGGVLVHRHGDPVEEVVRLAAELDVTEVFVTRDHGPYGRRRDAAAAARLRADGRRLRGVGSNYAVEPGRVVKADGSAYSVFTPFSKAWRSIGWSAPLARPEVRWLGAPDVSDHGPPDRPDVQCAFPPLHHVGVLDQWRRFRDEQLVDYAGQRDLPGVGGTSRLSAALRWGLVHPRTLLADLQPRRGDDVFSNELAWREFYADVLARDPVSAWSNLGGRLGSLPFDTGPTADARFDAWAAGRTGFPIVDAGMRELLATGWMHNRVRMIVASFLVKDLHLPWQRGARHFMQHLVDGDLASNSHGWQWVAGTGTDAAPYFRVFNPEAQSRRYDPDGEYVRRWVPELAALDNVSIHAPGALRPVEYPPPLVDHASERIEALRRYEVARAGSR